MESIHSHRQTGEVTRQPGRKGVNQAVAAARLQPLFYMHVVEDDVGQSLFKSVKEAGGRLRLAMVMVADDGSNMILIALGANSKVAPDMIESAPSSWRTTIAAEISVCRSLRSIGSSR